jgi:hypothetical protein
MGIEYSSLHEKDEIRLLRLEPGTGSTQVKCSLFHARLGESPTYDALSYMWNIDTGQRNSKTSMLAIDGPRTLEVRENLGNALRHLRLKDKVRVLWVDAICINQVGLFQSASSSHTRARDQDLFCGPLSGLARCCEI